MIAVSARHEYMGGTRGSCIMSSVYDVLWIRFGGWEAEELVEYVKCVCVWLGARWEVRGEWMRVLGLGFTNSVETGIV